MSRFPIYHYRLYEDPVERYFNNQLDLFDPWNDLYEPTSPQTAVVLVPQSFRWVNEPRVERRANQNKQQEKQQTHAQKFRVQLNIAGFNPETISTKVEQGKVVVEGKQEERQETGDFNVRHFRKSYPLPENADAEHLTSYVTPNHILVIEVPVVQPKPKPEVNTDRTSLEQFGEFRDPTFNYGTFLDNLDFQPKIVENENKEKQLELSVEMKKYRPDEIKVSVKNDELIVKGEHRHSDANHYERSFFFKSTRLPPGTQTEKLQSFLTDDGHLKIQAPFVSATTQPQPIQQKDESHSENTNKDS